MVEYLDITAIQSAAQRIAGVVHRTPTLSASALGDMAGVRLHLKAELFQKTGSFKPRGVINTLSQLSAEQRARGLVSLSAGNHAQALAWGAARMGTAATIVMPSRAVQSKIDATRAYGGTVVLTDEKLMDVARSLEAERGLTFMHAFDDLRIMAGQGTVGLEILEDVPDVDLVIVPVGGGGLIGGMATAIKSQAPRVRVVGVEPVGSAVMSRSRSGGEPATWDRHDTIADGLAAPFAGEHCLRHVHQFVDDVVLVEDDAIVRALRLLVSRAKVVPEPSGAAPLAALLEAAVEVPRGARVVCVVSGGNIDLATLREVLGGSRWAASS